MFVQLVLNFYLNDDNITTSSQSDSVINMQQSNSNNNNNINEIIENIILYEDNFIEQHMYCYEEETKDEFKDNKNEDLNKDLNLNKDINIGDNKLQNEEVIDYSFEELKI